MLAQPFALLPFRAEWRNFSKAKCSESRRPRRRPLPRARRVILAPCSTFGPGKLLCVESLSGSSALLASLCDPPSGSPPKGSERGQLGQIVHPPTPLLRCCLSPPTESGRTAQGGRLSAPLHPHSAAALCFLLLPVYPGISHSVVSNSATPWTAARRAPLSVGFSRQGVGCHFLLQGIIPTQGSNPGLLYCRQILYHLRHAGKPKDGHSLSIHRPAICTVSGFFMPTILQTSFRHKHSEFSQLPRDLWASQVSRVVKNSPANAGDLIKEGLIPGLGRSPGGGNGTPLQYPCLENPMDRGAWWAIVDGVTKSGAGLQGLSTGNTLI